MGHKYKNTTQTMKKEKTHEHSVNSPLKKNQDLHQVFDHFITKENLETQKLLLMISGGVDSMVLLHIAAQTLPKNQIAVFHLNHNLRITAKEDALFIQKKCSKLGVTYFSKVLEKNNKQPNQEKTWRDARKRHSINAAKEFGAKHILTAHHATDLVETMIFRLTKGTGPSGLSPFDTTTKPFWQVPKQVIINYATINNIKWKEDQTNADISYQRNRIRREVLPALRHITPNLEQVFTQESETFSEISNYLSQQTPQTAHMPLEEFLKLPEVIKKQWLIQRANTQPSYRDLIDCLRWLENHPEGNSQKKLGKITLTIQKNLIQELT